MKHLSHANGVETNLFAQTTKQLGGNTSHFAWKKGLGRRANLGLELRSSGANLTVGVRLADEVLAFDVPGLGPGLGNPSPPPNRRNFVDDPPRPGGGIQSPAARGKLSAGELGSLLGRPEPLLPLAPAHIPLREMEDAYVGIHFSPPPLR